MLLNWPADAAVIDMLERRLEINIDEPTRLFIQKVPVECRARGYLENTQLKAVTFGALSHLKTRGTLAEHAAKVNSPAVAAKRAGKLPWEVPVFVRPVIGDKEGWHGVQFFRLTSTR